MPSKKSSSEPRGKAASPQKGSGKTQKKKTGAPTAASAVSDARSSAKSGAAKARTSASKISHTAGAKATAASQAGHTPVGYRSPSAGRLETYGASTGNYLLSEPVIRDFNDVRGQVRIERNNRVEVYVRERKPEETTLLADYLRARKAFSSDQLLAQSLGVRRSRLSAWISTQALPTADEAQMLAHLAIVVHELANALHPDSFYGWLITEQYTLDMRTPLDALREGHLADVLQAVNAAEHLAYI